MQLIIDNILKNNNFHQGFFHGKSHWDRVAEYGRYIATLENVDENIIVYFAYFHDCQRESDGYDPDHGPRAAEFLKAFYSPEKLEISEIDFQRLVTACQYHTHECETDDITIKACWDCDRLDLGRVGIIPDPKYLFTQTAKMVARGELKISLETKKRLYHRIFDKVGNWLKRR